MLDILVIFAIVSTQLILCGGKKSDSPPKPKSTKGNEGGSQIGNVPPTPPTPQEEEKKEEEKKEEEPKKEEEKKEEEGKKDKSESKSKQEEEKKKEEEKKEDEKKKDEEEQKKKEEDLKKNQEAHIRIEEGGLLEFKTTENEQKKVVLKNVYSKKVMFKVRSSNNTDYMVNPVYGTIDPGATLVFAVTHKQSAAPKDDKLVIMNTVFTGDEFDLEKTFKASKMTGESVTVKMSAK